MARILLLAFGAIVALYLLKKFKRLDGPARRKVWLETLVMVGVVAAVLVFARFGLHWLGVLVAAAWALLRGLLPYAMRLLPLIQRGRASKRQEPSNEAPPGGSTSAAGTPGNGNAKPRQLMSREEALQVLGVQEGASREAILVAYRNLMRKVHPDSPGGSNYLASKLNQAKDVLLS